VYTSQKELYTPVVYKNPRSHWSHYRTNPSVEESGTCSGLCSS
jgi:hypothetical protein